MSGWRVEMQPLNISLSLRMYWTVDRSMLLCLLPARLLVNSPSIRKKNSW